MNNSIFLFMENCLLKIRNNIENFELLFIVQFILIFHIKRFSNAILHFCPIPFPLPPPTLEFYYARKYYKFNIISKILNINVLKNINFPCKRFSQMQLICRYI